MSYRAASCEKCKGDVYVPSFWHSIYPPRNSDFCKTCNPPRTWVTNNEALAGPLAKSCPHCGRPQP